MVRGAAKKKKKQMGNFDDDECSLIYQILDL
jgi:hypothetical protein